jgi:hypothetical protein
MLNATLTGWVLGIPAAVVIVTALAGWPANGNLLGWAPGGGLFVRFLYPSEPFPHPNGAKA